MRLYLFADSDNAGSRTLEHRRRSDLAFLERLRTADAEELDRMLWEHPRLPEWRRIAIARAVARQGTE